MKYKVSKTVCTGRRHESEDMACQDAVSVFRSGEVLCCALADGAGSRKNSGEGAHITTRYVAEMLCRRFCDFWDMPEEQRAFRITGACRNVLMKQESPLRELACTLMFFAVHEDGRYLCGHIGDGVIMMEKDGEMQAFSMPENGNYLNETFFLTSDGAERHFRISKGMLQDAGSLLMMSDGTAAGLYQRNTGQPAPACSIIAQWLKEGEEENIDAVLESKMKTLFAKYTEDDMSMIVVCWNEKKDWKEYRNE